MDDLIAESTLILNEYDAYRKGCRRAYKEVYEFTKHFSNVVDWMDNLTSQLEVANEPG